MTDPTNDPDKKESADPLLPHDEGGEQGGATERGPDQLVKMMTSTVGADDFGADGIHRAALREAGTNVRDDVAAVVRNVLETASQSIDELPQFTLLTQELDIEQAGRDATTGDAIPSRYEIIECIGSGDNGQVFAVFDNNFEREIAARFLHPSRAKEGDELQRFFREARITGSLVHPGITPVYDVDMTEGGLAFFTMKKLEGVSLARCIAQSQPPALPQPPIRSYFDRVDIMIRVCEAVAFAHGKGVLHLDIKPENVVVGTNGDVTLTDWRTAATKAELAEGSVALHGTPAYMSPEQAMHGTLDERSDIYCLGATLFHLLTFRLPIWSDDLETFWERKRTGDLEVPTADERQHIPGALLAIAMRALAADPTQRYATVAAMVEDLRHWQQSHQVQAQAKGAGATRRTASFAALTLSAIIGGGLAFSAQRWWPLTAAPNEVWQVAVEQRFTAGREEVVDDWIVRYVDAGVAHADGSPLSLDQGTLLVDGSSPLDLLATRSVSGDLRIDCLVQLAESASSVAVMVGGSSRGHARLFRIERQGDAWHFRCLRSSIEVAMLSLPPSKADAHHLQVERRGQRLSCIIDGRQVFAFTDPDVLTGGDADAWGLAVDGAAVRLDDIIVSQPQLSPTVNGIAVADGLLAAGQWEAARSAYETIIRRLPGHDMAVLARYRLARCAEGAGDLQGARRLLDDFLTRYPQHDLRFFARLRLAELLAALDRKPAARAVLATLIADTQAPEAVRHGGSSLLERWDAAEVAPSDGD